MPFHHRRAFSWQHRGSNGNILIITLSVFMMFLHSKEYDLEIQGDSMREMDNVAELERIRAAQAIKLSKKALPLLEEMLSFAGRIRMEASGGLEAKNVTNPEAWITLFNSRKLDAAEKACKKMI